MNSLRLFLASLCVLCGHAFSADSAAAPKGERVFVTAHSFHIFVAPRLAPLAKAAGIEGHVLAGQQMIGGSKVIQHWELPAEKNKARPALTTYCNFACIYRISPVGLKTPNAALDKLSPDLDPLLRQIAWDTVRGYAKSGVTAK